jgi:predicted ester cyclase
MPPLTDGRFVRKATALTDDQVSVANSKRKRIEERPWGVSTIPRPFRPQRSKPGDMLDPRCGGWVHVTTEENKAVARRFFEEVVSSGDLGVVDAICAPNYRLHATLSGPDAINRYQLKDLVRSWRSSFGDGRISIEDLVAEGDLVAARMVETGTHTGEFKSVPPSGREVRYGSMTFLRIQGGKIVEHWGLLDMPTLLQQIGRG